MCDQTVWVEKKLQVYPTIIRKACNVVLKSSKHESITFPDEFIFMFAPYFIGAISSKIVVKSGKLGKKVEKVDHKGSQGFL